MTDPEDDQARLPQRPLGQSGLQVSSLGLGTVAFGRQAGLKYARAVERPSDAALIELLRTAQRLGVTLLDTATAYGDSQARLGQLLPELADNRFLLCTKVGEHFEQQRSHFDFSAGAVEDDLAAAREQLGRPVVDIVLLHSDGTEEAALCRGPGFEALQTARSRGDVRAIGLSAKTAAGIQAACAVGADVLMVTLNHSDQTLAPAIEAAATAGLGVLIKKPLASGHRPAEELRWVGAQPGVSAVVVGTLNPDHLRRNAGYLR